MGFLQDGLPRALVCGYRRIPCRVRSLWSMGTSSSGKALERIGAGEPPWAVIRSCTAGWRFLPGYAAGTALRIASLGMLASGPRTGVWWMETQPAMGLWWDASWDRPRNFAGFLARGFAAGLGRASAASWRDGGGNWQDRPGSSLDEEFGWLRNL